MRHPTDGTVPYNEDPGVSLPRRFHRRDTRHRTPATTSHLRDAPFERAPLQRMPVQRAIVHQTLASVSLRSNTKVSSIPSSNGFTLARLVSWLEEITILPRLVHRRPPSISVFLHGAH